MSTTNIDVCAELHDAIHVLAQVSEVPDSVSWHPKWGWRARFVVSDPEVGRELRNRLARLLGSDHHEMTDHQYDDDHLFSYIYEAYRGLGVESANVSVVVVPKDQESE